MNQRRLRKPHYVAIFLAAIACIGIWLSVSRPPNSTPPSVQKRPPASLEEQDPSPLSPVRSPAPSTDQPDSSSDPRDPTHDESVTLNFAVIDEQGVGLRGADVYAFDGRSLEARTGTDDDGVCAITLPIAEAVTVVASATGHASNYVFLSVPQLAEANRAKGEERPRFEIMLGRPCSLVGTVRIAGSETGVGGITVLAYPARAELLSPDLVHRLKHGTMLPSMGTTTSGPDGRFEIDGLLAGSNYRIAAGGRGYATIDSSWRAPKIPAPASDVVVEVARHHGAIIAVEDPLGRAVPIRSNAPMPMVAILDYPIPPGQAVRGLNESAAFSAGMVPDGDLKPNERVVLCRTTDSSVPSLEMNLDVAVPGYAPSSVRVRLTPIDRPLAVERVVLQRSVGGVGAVRFALPLPLPQGHVSFDDENDETNRFNVQVDDTETELVIHDVPIGAYRVAYHGRRARLRCPASRNEFLRIAVTDGGTTEAVLECVPTGSITIDIAPDFRTQPIARLVVSLSARPLAVMDGRTGLNDAFNFVLERPPFVIRGVPFGTYHVHVEQPSGSVPRILGPIVVAADALEPCVSCEFPR